MSLAFRVQVNFVQNKSVKMTSIVKAGEKDSQLLSEMAKLTFIESHGSSTKTEDINTYVTEHYNSNVFTAELSEAKNVYHIIYQDKRPVG